MERYPRGTLPPAAYAALNLAREGGLRPTCDMTTICPTCLVEMQPEHAHYKCAKCGYRDSCCF
ncbi:MAG TPA: hypothetical protein VGM88_03210 [Kofleriaceae bacterium]|jgi:tRNA(Ile2) C34 agmatinyltransferase TiaS